VSHKHLNPLNPDRPERVAIVISNPAVSTTTGLPVGFWWAELTHPYFHFTEAGRLTAALCHGVAVLRYARLASGEPLVKGKTVTGFANVEEDFADQAARDMGLLSPNQHVMPWRIEDELKALGANYVQAGLWKGFAIRDGNLLTGQQNFSGGETAQLIVETLGR
jgi:putative intracellular protease/amidase